jgi:hypothetical protein
MNGATLGWPINGSSAQYILGLTPGAWYGISSIGQTLVVSSNGTYQASPAGVIVYLSGCSLSIPSESSLHSPLRHAIFCHYNVK